jgi:transcriptional regulator with XRE-family HTH domain
MELGAQIRKIREELGLSQEQLAGRVGTAQSTISQLEQGERNPSYKTLRSLANALGVSVSYLLGEADVEELSDEEELLFREYRGLSDDARRQLREYARFLQQVKRPARGEDDQDP